MNAALTPTDVAVSRSAGTCTVTWADGAVHVHQLTDLRAWCPCAPCNDEREARKSNPFVVLSGAPPTAELGELQQVGGYALRFVWADGHNTGIWSYDYLRRLGE